MAAPETTKLTIRLPRRHVEFARAYARAHGDDRFHQALVPVGDLEFEQLQAQVRFTQRLPDVLQQIFVQELAGVQVGRHAQCGQACLLPATFCWQEFLNAQRPIGTLSPVSSASGMNRMAAIGPTPRACHRHPDPRHAGHRRSAACSIDSGARWRLPRHSTAQP